MLFKLRMMASLLLACSCVIGISGFSGDDVQRMALATLMAIVLWPWLWREVA